MRGFNSMRGYLENLTIRLSAGLAEADEDARRRHATYLLAAQQPDGGFAGREGGSDLYYTGFALRGLSVLGELYGDPARRAAEFLQGRLSGRESIVDFLSLIYGAALIEAAAGIDVFARADPAWRDAVSASLELLRRDDGGYAKSHEGRASSTYHTFLVVLCRQLIERPTPEPERAVAFLRGQQDDEGGFREIRVQKRGGTNPTAAAVAVLRIFDALDDATRDATLDFLAEMQTDEGGLRANTRIPVADLLSTFTGLLTLADLGAAEEINLPAVERFVRSLERPEGGFHGASLDDGSDVEYTLYGLGCLGLLRGAAM
jgi:geranylgeranyl transferase type-2 subunit beta